MTADWVLTPDENYERDFEIVCPQHPDRGEIMPGYVCPLCRWPERPPTKQES